MKLRKLLLCVLTAATICGVSSVNTYAAEADNNAATIATEETTTDENKQILNTEEVKETTEITKEEGKETTITSDSEKKTESKKTTVSKKTTKKTTKTTKATTKKTSKKTTVKKAKKAPKVRYSSADLKLMSSIIFCEAGSESYAGKLAVGIVVKNRVESGRFPNSLRGVVYQKYQFGPVRNGSLSKALSRYSNGKFTSSYHKSSIRAAKEALNGVKKVNYKGKTLKFNKYLYFSGRVSKAKVTIGNHQFK